MRRLMYFYLDNPEYAKWGLPWKVMMRNMDQKDPYYARHNHFTKKAMNEKKDYIKRKKVSPYYLPGDKHMHPLRMPFVEGTPPQPKLNFWWKESAALEHAFRRRLGQARSFEFAHPDHREPLGYKAGEGRGGGGPHGDQVHKRDKNYKFVDVRPY
eukprot:GHVL01035096.1.p1 GENE.GHVL01035096.1~~GHVL01035096.1.p1  ORF type:complete len:155 (+),score=21.22 GHVL01035096.1:442-906(+)